MAKLPTVKIKCGEGFLRINESDYNPKIHELFEEPVIEEVPTCPPKRSRQKPIRAEEVEELQGE